MTEDEFEKLKKTILASGGQAITPDPKWDANHYWLCYSTIFLKYVSTRSKYNGSILRVERIKNDKIQAYCLVAGASKIRPESHFKNYEVTNERKVKYVDGTESIDSVKDFFDDEINVGDYVFGEYDRNIVFGIVRSTKKGAGKKKAYRSSILEYDAAMIEVVKSKNRIWDHDITGNMLLMEMRYFIKVEDPTLYLLKL